MATGTMGLRGWRPAGWSGFIAGVALGAVLVAVAWGAAVVAGNRSSELVATSAADPAGAYVAAMVEHERLIGEALALELAAERSQPRLTVVAPVGLPPVESYAAEHRRLIQAALGDEVWGGQPRLDVASAAGQGYVDEHERLLAADGAFFPAGE